MKLWNWNKSFLWSSTFLSSGQETPMTFCSIVYMSFTLHIGLVTVLVHVLDVRSWQLRYSANDEYLCALLHDLACVCCRENKLLWGNLRTVYSGATLICICQWFWNRPVMVSHCRSSSTLDAVYVHLRGDPEWRSDLGLLGMLRRTCGNWEAELVMWVRGYGL